MSIGVGADKAAVIVRWVRRIVGALAIATLSVVLASCGDPIGYLQQQAGVVGGGENQPVNPAPAPAQPQEPAPPAAQPQEAAPPAAQPANPPPADPPAAQPVGAVMPNVGIRVYGGFYKLNPAGTTCSTWPYSTGGFNMTINFDTGVVTGDLSGGGQCPGATSRVTHSGSFSGTVDRSGALSVRGDLYASQSGGAGAAGGGGMGGECHDATGQDIPCPGGVAPGSGGRYVVTVSGTVVPSAAINTGALGVAAREGTVSGDWRMTQN